MNGCRLASFLLLSSSLLAFSPAFGEDLSNTLKEELQQLYKEVQELAQENAIDKDQLLYFSNDQANDVAKILMEIPQPSLMIRTCVEQLQKDNPVLTVEQALEVIPTLFEYAVDSLDSVKAPRPDAVSPTANNAIVGKSDGCDLTPVIALLNTIKKQLIELREIICQKFMETWTILEDIKSDIFDTQTILCGKFFETWTILADIEQDIFDTQTILCGKFFETWTILDALSACDPTPIFEPITITEPGTYCLANDIAGQITIAASRVYLDMNGKQISGGTNGIEVTAGMSDIYVFNGTIGATSERGFLVNPGSTNINITAVDFVNSPTGLAFIDGVMSHQFANIENTSFRDQTSIAATFENCLDLRIHDMVCRVDPSSQQVLEFIGSNQNVSCSQIDIGPIPFAGPARVITINTITKGTFDSCFIHNCPVASGAFDGIIITDSNDLVFSNCTITNCSTVTSFPFQGIRLLRIFNPITNNILFNNCQVNSNSFGSNAASFGIQATLCQDITFKQCQVNNNVGPGALEFRGISSMSCAKFICLDCQCNDNQSAIYTLGYSSDSSLDVLFEQSIALDNVGTATAIGFLSFDDTKPIFQSCIANDNLGSNNYGAGFRLEQAQQGCLLNSLAKRNRGSVTDAEGVGIDLIDTVSCEVRQNIVINNMGDTPANSYGIRSVTSATSQTTVLLNNTAQGHFDSPGGASGLENNFFILAGSPGAGIPASILDVATGVFTPMPPGPYDNISVE